VLPLGACTTSTATPEPNPFTETSYVCEQVSDAGTLIFNLEGSVAAGRAVEGELDGAKRVAARMINRIEIDESSDLGPLVAKLQELTPRTDVAAQGESYDTRSDEWAQAHVAVLNQCELDGGVFGVEGWVGG
jgi:hypothetical protein